MFHEKIELFHKNLPNIFDSFIPNKIIVCDESNSQDQKMELREKIGYFKVKEWLVTFTLLFQVCLCKIYQTLLNIL